jgi:acetolactate synthase-1/2/3 large subunit
MARKTLAVDNVAEAYLALLAERGVEYLFANAGTDFAPLVEAFAKAAPTGRLVPLHCLAPDRDAERGAPRRVAYPRQC